MIVRFIIIASALTSVAVALQNSRRRKKQTPSQHDYEVLKDIFQTDAVLKFNVCNSSRYEKYYEDLPPLRISDLKLPPNVTILFYGHSYLHQILDNILAANYDDIYKNGPLGGLEGFRFKSFRENNAPDGDYEFQGYVVRWDLATSTRILEIQNSYDLQHAHTAEDELHGLKRFLNDTVISFGGKKFDIAFFMNPHPECYWHTECKGRKGEMKGALSDDYLQAGDYIGDRSDMRKNWEIIKEAVNGKAYEVEAWSPIPRPQNLFHADVNHCIHTSRFLNKDTCNTIDNCEDASWAKGLQGHQCQPGRLATVAEKVVAKIYEELGL